MTKKKRHRHRGIALIENSHIEIVSVGEVCECGAIRLFTYGSLLYYGKSRPSPARWRWFKPKARKA